MGGVKKIIAILALHTLAANAQNCQLINKCFFFTTLVRDEASIYVFCELNGAVV
jgi:hypothetical protein